MYTQRVHVGLIAAALAGLALAAAVRADEGMWVFNHPPREILQKRYGFNATDEWLRHVQRSSVRFNNGGSGSFVSADGLVMTNHHIGLDCLEKLSKNGKDYVKDGFHARTRAEEAPCPDLELNVLMSIEDVTDRVNAAVKPSMKPAQAAAARQAVMAAIEKESLQKTGLRSDVVTLYQGGQYHLYRYKRYTDVRLVLAPEQQIAFYGGDPDNFEYPRYDLDMCFFRVYEDGRPLHPKDYLRWSKAGATKGELVFVPGHPGRTDRLDTVAELEYLRDRGVPNVLERLYRWEVLLGAWSERSEENARRSKELLFYVKNSRKARDGGEAGLLDPVVMGKKKAEELKLRSAVAEDVKQREVADAWDRIAAAQKVRAAHARDFILFELGVAGRDRMGAGFNSRLFLIARTLLRAAEELPKPNGQRLREFRDSDLPSLKQQLFSPAPIYKDFERLKLADALTYLAEQLGAENPMVVKVLAGKSAQERATELIDGTKLEDVSLRKKLYEGGKSAVLESKDPMIELARLIDPTARAVRKVLETEVEEVMRQSYAQIARAKYAVEGSSVYPDATFTLRLAFGVVKGYEENGRQVSFETHFRGLYRRAAEHQNKPPFDLPPRWMERKDRLDLDTPLNFVSTADIIGGNSGSPVINKDAEVVGLIFDGNIQSLVLDFVYTEKQARAVAVHSRAIVEALRKVYDAGALADELTGRTGSHEASKESSAR
jgi:hypothetical protein